MKKFTQEIKNQWLEALKSGKYIQGFGELVYEKNGQTFHCCIGVLGDIIPFLCNDELKKAQDTEQIGSYEFLENNFGKEFVISLYRTNDNIYLKFLFQNNFIERNYSNVIPMIEDIKIPE